MKIWAKTEDLSEGKYLVVRRDGSIPAWPHFVLGARDPHAVAALRAYAQSMWLSHFPADYDREYIDSILELAQDFENYRNKNGDGDPTATKHRKDHPDVIYAMRRYGPVLIPVYPEEKPPPSDL